MQEYEENFDKMHSFKPKLAKKPKNFEYSVEKLYDNKEKALKIAKKKEVFLVIFVNFIGFSKGN